jgi:signal transduction histidine kinase
MTQEKMLVKRLAQTLHDQLGQTLAAVRMAHETIIALQGDTATPAIDRLQKQLGLLVGQSIRQVRQVLVDLRPPLLEEQGLAAALDNELRNRSLTQPNMDISIHVPPDLALMRWPTEVEYAAFMVAREAVENALRHSGATLVSVALSGSPTALTMKVVDNGTGLEKGDMTKTGHLGMLGMQERANAIAATVTVDSDAQRGTCITFSWQPF